MIVSVPASAAAAPPEMPASTSSTPLLCQATVELDGRARRRRAQVDDDLPGASARQDALALRARPAPRLCCPAATAAGRRTRRRARRVCLQDARQQPAPVRGPCRTPRRRPRQQPLGGRSALPCCQDRRYRPAPASTSFDDAIRSPGARQQDRSGEPEAEPAATPSRAGKRSQTSGSCPATTAAPCSSASSRTVWYPATISSRSTTIANGQPRSSSS